MQRRNYTKTDCKEGEPRKTECKGRTTRKTYCDALGRRTQIARNEKHKNGVRGKINSTTDCDEGWPRTRNCDKRGTRNHIARKDKHEVKKQWRINEETMKIFAANKEKATETRRGERKEKKRVKCFSVVVTKEETDDCGSRYLMNRLVPLGLVESPY